LVRAAERVEGLDLLVLHGSRARGEARVDSDWDFAVIGDARLDISALLASLVDALGTDRVDLADLTRAGAVLRFRVARDGIVVFERRAGAFESFAVSAAQLWCDMEPVLRRAHADYLAEWAR
jgi:predicted nucleotidyltransferase